MKKTMMTLITLVCLLTIAASALAYNTELVFTKRDFYGGQSLPVYSGPGYEYIRGSNGWAKADTDEPLYAAGMENGWALVMYETSNGSVRVGYVDLEQFHYDLRILKLSEIDFDYMNATITRDCILTDDPALNNRELAVMKEGTNAVYLASFYMHRSWAYIETWVDGKPIRAFVPADCVMVD